MQQGPRRAGEAQGEVAREGGPEGGGGGTSISQAHPQHCLVALVGGMENFSLEYQFGICLEVLWPLAWCQGGTGRDSNTELQYKQNLG